MTNNRNEAASEASSEIIEFGVDKQNKVDKASKVISIYVSNNPNRDTDKILGENPIVIPAHNTEIAKEQEENTLNQ